MFLIHISTGTVIVTDPIPLQIQGEFENVKAIIPIENSLAGRVADIHYLLPKYKLQIYYNLLITYIYKLYHYPIKHQFILYTLYILYTKYNTHIYTFINIYCDSTSILWYGMEYVEYSYQITIHVDEDSQYQYQISSCSYH